jgi:hypothetical protein
MRRLALLLTFAAGPLMLAQSLEVTGHVLDPQGKPVASAAVHLLVGSDDIAQTKSDSQGEFRFDGLIRGSYTLRAEAPAFITVAQSVTVGETREFDVQFRKLTAQKQSVVITAKILEPGVDLRNSEVFNRTFFTRDDQVLQQLNAGINAGQHEGGGKSLEIRRFGFNLDHGGVNGGLKVLVDDVGQNQGTQGHGQGYLGSLKALSPELITVRDHVMPSPSRRWPVVTCDRPAGL